MRALLGNPSTSQKGNPCYRFCLIFLLFPDYMWVTIRLLSAVASQGLPVDFQECFDDMISLLNKIEVWWIINVEIPTDPDLDGRDVDESGIVPGSVMTIRLLQEIALGDEDTSRYYYDEFRRRTDSGESS